MFAFQIALSFIEPGAYLPYALVCKSFHRYLKIAGYARVTRFRWIEQVSLYLCTDCAMVTQLVIYLIRNDKFKYIELVEKNNKYIVTIYDPFVVHSSNNPVCRTVANAACAKGRLKPVKWLIRKGYRFDQSHLDDAALNGNFALIVMFLKAGVGELNPNTMLCAIRGHNHRLVKWLARKGVRVPEAGLNTLVAKDRVNIMEWLLIRNMVNVCDELLVRVKSVEMIKLIEKYVGRKEALINAMICDNRDILEWLTQKITFNADQIEALQRHWSQENREYMWSMVN